MGAVRGDDSVLRSLFSATWLPPRTAQRSMRSPARRNVLLANRTILFQYDAGMQKTGDAGRRGSAMATRCPSGCISRTRPRAGKRPVVSAQVIGSDESAPCRQRCALRGQRDGRQRREAGPRSGMTRAPPRRLADRAPRGRHRLGEAKIAAARSRRAPQDVRQCQAARRARRRATARRIPPNTPGAAGARSPRHSSQFPALWPYLDRLRARPARCGAPES